MKIPDAFKTAVEIAKGGKIPMPTASCLFRRIGAQSKPRENRLNLI